jgi:hypothetical protein
MQMTVGSRREALDSGSSTPRRRRRSVWGSLGGVSAWIGVAAAAAVVFVLGMVGFSRYQEAAGALEPISTRIYQSLGLFLFSGGALPGPVPWELNVARFAAPIVAAFTILRVLAAILHEQIDLLRLRSVRDHVIVAGLGRKGTMLAAALLDGGARVVVVEADASDPALGMVREMGGMVVEGDARSPAILQRAGVGRADTLVALCGEGGSNIEIAAQARTLVDARRPHRLHCVVHVADPDLGLLLCVEELERYGDARVRVDFVNVHAAAAQALLDAHPCFGPPVVGAPRVALVGGERTASDLLLALARAWAIRGPDEGQRPTVTVVGMDHAALASLRARHREIDRFLDVEEATALESPAPDRWPDMAYVCPDDDDAAAAAAMTLRGLLVGRPATIVVALEARSGLAHLLDGIRRPDGGPDLVTFGLLDEACRPEALLAGTTETLARALHDVYLAEVGADGDPDDPARLPWSELPEVLRESDRDQAAHVAVKLAAVGRVVAPLTDWDAALRPFGEADVEVMSRLEHDRWVAERRRSGWRPGPRDVSRRTTPYLVPWEELPEEVRDKDRMFVRRLPRMLASVGLQAVRRGDVAASEPAIALRPEPAVRPDGARVTSA